MGAKIGSMVCPDCMDTQDQFHKERRPTEKMSEAEIIEDIEILSSQDFGELLFHSRIRKYNGRRSLNMKSCEDKVVRFSSLQIRKRNLADSYDHSDSMMNQVGSQKHRRYEESTNPQTMQTGARTPSDDSPSRHGSMGRSNHQNRVSVSDKGDSKQQEHSQLHSKQNPNFKEASVKSGRLNADRQSRKDSEALAGILDDDFPALAVEYKDKVAPLPRDKPNSEIGSKSRRSGHKQITFQGNLPQPSSKHPNSVKNKSMKSNMSFDKSNYSFKTCLEFDNLTFNSLISPAYISAKSRMVNGQSPGLKSKPKGDSSAGTSRQVESKMELFQEMMFEMEHMAQYFDLLKPLPMEEPLITHRSENSQATPEQRVVTFAPKILELESSWGARTYKKRVLVSRGTSVIRSTVREFGIQANRQLSQEGCTRVIKRSLAAYLDFDNDWDTRIQYTFSGDGLQSSTTTVRIGTGKKFANGKTVHYIYERSTDIEDFYSCKEDQPLELLSRVQGDQPADKVYLLKHISKVEVLNSEFLKVDTYAELVVPQQLKLGVGRKAVRSWWLLGGSGEPNSEKQLQESTRTVKRVMPGTRE